MEPRFSAELEHRARRAYEIGRLHRALFFALGAVPLVGLSLWTSGQRLLTPVFGAALIAIVISFRWRGQGYGRAVPWGFVAGAIPWLVSMGLHRMGHCCSGGTCLPVCAVACTGAGLVVGLSLALLATRYELARRPFLVSASLVALLVGALGCLVVGMSAVLGMMAGLVVASTPFVLATRRA